MIQDWPTGMTATDKDGNFTPAFVQWLKGVTDKLRDYETRLDNGGL